MKEKITMLNLYFLLISVIWIVGLCIWYGVLIYTYLESIFITDQEYLIQNWTYISCENTTKAMETWTGAEDAQQKIDQCKQQKEENSTVIPRRHLNTKESMIGWWVWGSIFLILFLTHFPIFLKRNKDSKETA